MLVLLRAYFSHYQGISKQGLFALLSTALHALGFASIIFMPIYLHNTLSYSYIETGIAVSAYGFGTVIASYYGGRLCDIFSAYIVVLTALVLCIVSLLLLYFISHPYWLLIIFLIFFGISNAAFFPASRIYLMRLTPVGDQARINGIRYMLYNIGTAASFGIAGLVIHNNYRNVFIFSAFFVVSAICGFLFLCQPDIKHVSKKEVVKGKLWQDKFFLAIFIYFFIGCMIFAQVNATYALFLSGYYHLSTHKIGIVFLLNALTIGFFQVVIIKLISDFSQVIVMLIGCFFIGLGLLMVTFTHNYTFILFSVLIWTLGEMLFMPVSQNVIYQNAREELKGYYLGMYQALSAVAAIASPFLGGIALKLNNSGFVLWGGSFLLGAIPLCSYFILRKKLIL